VSGVDGVLLCIQFLRSPNNRREQLPRTDRDEVVLLKKVGCWKEEEEEG
jgi:hypothetical protein